MKLRLPPYVDGFTDRHGKPRYYFRHNGERVPLPGIPYTPEFMTAYEHAKAGVELIKPVGANRTMPGTVNAVIVSYYESEAFNGLKLGTRKMRRAILERFRAEHGEKRFGTLPTVFLVAMLGKMKPFAKRNWLKALRGLCAFAVTEGLRRDDPTQAIRFAKVKGGTIHTWTDEEIAQFETTHKLGTMARLALALALYTDQRRSDLVKMGRQHIKDGMLRTPEQEKTGNAAYVMIHPELQRAIDAMPTKNMTFLVTEQGKPFSAAGFGNKFREWCDLAGLPQCSVHGLRKAFCVRMAEADCTPHEIMAISGHLTLAEVMRYTAAVNQKKLAMKAMRKVIEAEQNRG